jgi:hypothetical protein
MMSPLQRITSPEVSFQVRVAPIHHRLRTSRLRHLNRVHTFRRKGHTHKTLHKLR